MARHLAQAALTVAAVLFVAVPASCAVGTRQEVRPPAVAGQFYPEQSDRLAAGVRALLADAVPPRGERPLALVVPHAGYVYSGQIAADGFRQAMGQRYDLVVILGTNHTTPDFDAVSVYDGRGYRTPLGIAEVDTQAAADLVAADRECRFDHSVHAREHSIEVQVPFVQIALPGVKILPLVVASQDPALCDRLGAALARTLSRRRALIVASSDLSHYPPYEAARASDRAVLVAIAGLDPAGLRSTIAAQMAAGRRGLETCACGEAPVLAAMAAARALGARRGTVVSWANSGDTPVGDRSRVVGYGAVMFTDGTPGADTAVLDAPAEVAPDAPLGPGEKRRLLAFARQTIERYLTTGTTPLARGLPPAASRRQGAFVTLYERGNLRGCIGHMAEDLPLGQTVGTMAISAALQDPRFPPLAPGELKSVEIEISALTPLQRVAGPEAIVIGRDGVQIRKDGRVAVFLPQVPVEQGWDRPTLMRELCLKAGLPENAWKSGAEFYAFRSILFRESEFR
jgi:hypothetical protein